MIWWLGVYTLALMVFGLFWNIASSEHDGVSRMFIFVLTLPCVYFTWQALAAWPWH